MVVFNPEFIQQGLEMVLSCQAGIGQISFDVRPVAQAVVVEYFQIVGNAEGYIVIPKAFTKQINRPTRPFPSWKGWMASKR